MADALARVDTEGDTCVSLPSIGLQEKLGIQFVHSDGWTADSQFKPVRGAEGVSSLFSVRRTPKLARLDIPQSCRTVDVEHHKQIMFLTTTIMDV